MLGVGLIKLGGVVLVMAALSQARPPRPDHAQNQPQAAETKPTNETDWELGVEYNRYLQEVVQVLESDPEFRKKLEEADVEKIRDGSIAEELDFLHHGIRNQLDDIKRQELERLRHLAMKQFELDNGIDKKHIKVPHHVEIQSPTFEKEDLKRLIKATTKDLEVADAKRREDFKKYEMEKKFEQDERLKHIDDEAKRKEEAQKIQEAEAKHKKHAKPHHPMSKDQLEEVWEEQDHMRAEDWDPKTFFAMHDLNGDQHWDEDEIRMLFKKELDKVYDPNAPEDDMRERQEEMERMREHVFSESDKNKDRLISYDEFLSETKRDEFDNDPGWDTLDADGHEDFSDEEFRAFEMQRQREIQDMLNRGVVPPGYPYYGDIPPGAHQFQPPQQNLGIPGQPAYNQEVYAGQHQQPYHQQLVPPGQPQQFQAQQQPPQYGAPIHQQQQQQPQQQQQQFGRSAPGQNQDTKYNPPQPQGGGQGSQQPAQPGQPQQFQQAGQAQQFQQPPPQGGQASQFQQQQQQQQPPQGGQPPQFQQQQQQPPQGGQPPQFQQQQQQQQPQGGQPQLQRQAQADQARGGQAQQFQPPAGQPQQFQQQQQQQPQAGQPPQKESPGQPQFQQQQQQQERGGQGQQFQGGQGPKP